MVAGNLPCLDSAWKDVVWKKTDSGCRRRVLAGKLMPVLKSLQGLPRRDGHNPQPRFLARPRPRWHRFSQLDTPVARLPFGMHVLARQIANNRYGVLHVRLCASFFVSARRKQAWRCARFALLLLLRREDRLSPGIAQKDRSGSCWANKTSASASGLFRCRGAISCFRQSSAIFRGILQAFSVKERFPLDSAKVRLFFSLIFRNQK